MENKPMNQNNGQGFAIASLVIGIFALLFSIIPCVGTSAIFIGIVAVVFGAVALTKATTPDAPKGMSIAGVSLGGLAILIAIFWLIFVVGSKSLLKNKLDHVSRWAEQFDNSSFDNNDDFDDMESLDNLENALDELEGAVDSANTGVNKAVNGVHDDVKKAIDDAREGIKDAKSKKNKKIAAPEKQ